MESCLVTSKFSYCLLIWMFHSRRLNNNNESTFQELLNKDDSVSIHHRNLQVLATELFKITEICFSLYITLLNLYRFWAQKDVI